MYMDGAQYEERLGVNSLVVVLYFPVVFLQSLSLNISGSTLASKRLQREQGELGVESSYENSLDGSESAELNWLWIEHRQF